LRDLHVEGEGYLHVRYWYCISQNLILKHHSY